MSSDDDSGGDYGDAGDGGGGGGHRGTTIDCCECCDFIWPYVPDADNVILYWAGVLMSFLFIPGTGVILLGVVGLMGKEKNEERGKNSMYWLIIGAGMLFSSAFMGLGWIWSFLWGVLILAKRCREDPQSLCQTLA